MDRIRSIFKLKQPYQPIEHDPDEQAESQNGYEATPEPEANSFSHVEYWIFLLLGIAMLWAWNMFLAAAPYFQYRFSPDKWILAHFQSAVLSVFTITNLVSIWALTKLQKNASYPNRIVLSLCINTICFILLALSTLVMTSTGVYFGFLMLMVFCASLATGLIQNGLFAYVSGFGRSEYTQAIMTGQGVAGVLPSLAQIGSVLAIPKKEQQSPSQTSSESPKSAFVYFLTATLISIISLVAFVYLLSRRSTHNIQYPPKPNPDGTTISEHSNLTSPHPSPPPIPEPMSRKSIPLTALFLKLPSLSTALFLTFALTMLFPIFTTIIPSLNPNTFPPTLFIPLAFLAWNIGDLSGRLLTLLPSLSLTAYPSALLLLALARIIFIPLYLLCNVHGRGAKIPSDLFYLGVVQLGFGISNGYLGSECMMAAGRWVGAEEREAAGGFMGFCLVAGLTVGSLLSFCLGGV